MDNLTIDNLTCKTVVMKAVPAYELFCELSNNIGENFLSLAIKDNISVHILIAQKCASPVRVRDSLKKLFNATFKDIFIDGVLHLQDDMPLALWCKMIDIAIKVQFSDFFLDLQKSLSDLSEI